MIWGMEVNMWKVIAILFGLSVSCFFVANLCERYHATNYEAKAEYFHEVTVNGIVYMIYTGQGQICVVGEDGQAVKVEQMKEAEKK